MGIIMNELLFNQQFQINQTNRIQLKGHQPALLWLTGLSGAGKSTIANRLDVMLNQKKCHTYVLDGDNIRLGINNDLGFSNKDRHENIRRIGEIGKLFIDAGLIVIASFISPFAVDRKQVRSLFTPGQFIEVFVDCSLHVCQKRDPKGLYVRALNGEIAQFTGISQAYEQPEHPEVIVQTEKNTVDDCTRQIIHYLIQKSVIEGESE